MKRPGCGRPHAAIENVITDVHGVDTVAGADCRGCFAADRLALGSVGGCLAYADGAAGAWRLAAVAKQTDPRSPEGYDPV